MAEQIGVRPREPEAAAGLKFVKAQQDQKRQVNRQMTTPLVIKAPKKEEYELCPMGLLGWYLHPLPEPENCLHEWRVWTHDIRGVSGRHRHQGGAVLFVTEGVGYTTMNGERFDWEEGDLVMIPLMPEQVEHQHFNAREDGPSKWLAFVHMPTWNLLGGEVVQKAVDPEWAEKSGQSTYDDAGIATEHVEPQAESA